MAELRLETAEMTFAEIVWENEPLTTAVLVKKCGERLGWKRSTTYTVLRRLTDRGYFQTENSVVTSLVSRDEFYAKRSRSFVDTAFHGSLPAFLAAFTGGSKLSAADIDELQKLIDDARKAEEAHANADHREEAER